MDPKSVDSFEELSQKFLEEFSQQKRYAKDPTEIHGIKRRMNEGLQAFTHRFKSESSHIKGMPPVLRISAFMHGHGHPELAKKLNDKIPKIVDEMFERVRAFIRGEAAVGSTEVARVPQWDDWEVDRYGNANLAALLVCRRSPLPNVIIRKDQNEKSLGQWVRTIHSMITFPKGQGMLPQMRNQQGSPYGNCKQIEENANFMEETHGVALGNKMVEKTEIGRKETLRRNADVFAWTTMVNMVVPRFVMEHQLQAYPLAELVVHKKRPLTPDRRNSVKRKKCLMAEGGKRYLAKNADGDYTVLNKVCAKGYIPLPRNRRGSIGSTGDYRYKCFLVSIKEHSQVRMSKNDEEKTCFHTEEGIYCFTHMPKGLKKNSAATLQRMMDKVLGGQKGRNMEVYLEVVVKSKTEKSLIEDVEETLHKLRRVNIKIDSLVNCPPFGMEEGDRNLLHSDREGGASTDSHDKVPEDNLSKAQSQIEQGGGLRIKRETSRRTSPNAKGVEVVCGKRAVQGSFFVGMISNSPEEKCSCIAIRLNFHTSRLALIMKHFGTVEGSRIPRTKEAKKYREEVKDVTAPFHRFRITHLPKALNPKAKALTGLASIRLEFLNQEVLVGVKTRPTVEAACKDLEEARNVTKKAVTENLSPTWQDHSGSN
ncbi:hypothetical protein Tco_1096450 [Tanacetum coccineum]